MNASHRVLLVLCFVAGFSRAEAQTVGDLAKKQDALLADVGEAKGSLIETAELQDELPFAQFLDKLNRQLQKRAKISVRFDRAAFGKEADKMLAKQVSLPPVPRRMNAATAVRLALAQTYTVHPEIEFIVRPGEFVITTRDHSFSTVSHDVRDLLNSTQRLHNELLAMRKQHVDDEPFRPIDERADPKKPGEWLVQQILWRTLAERAGWRGRTPASTIRLENGTKLIVHTVPSVHAEIFNILSDLRRLIDLAVVMNARLYELDRAEFDKHFAPAFVDPENKASRRMVVKATEALVKRLRERKPDLESDPDKLIPGRSALFLAMRNAFQYQAKPGDDGVATGFEGFTFTVRPIVSPDRRCIRLELSQEVAQLVKITKGTMVDWKTGKEVPVELANVRKTTATAAIEIHDEQAILIAVNYRPATKDKVWLVLAKPMIYMEEEQEQIRKGWIPSSSGVTIPRMPMADEKPPAPAEPSVEEAMLLLPSVELPNTAAIKELLQAILVRTVGDPEFAKCQRVVGTPGDKRIALAHWETDLAWPKTFRPAVPGFTLVTIDPTECQSFKPRLAGIYIGRYRRTEAREGTQIYMELSIRNVGGIVNGADHGWWEVQCEARRSGSRWIIKSFDFHQGLHP